MTTRITLNREDKGLRHGIGVHVVLAIPLVIQECSLFDYISINPMTIPGHPAQADWLDQDLNNNRKLFYNKCLCNIPFPILIPWHQPCFITFHQTGQRQSMGLNDGPVEKNSPKAATAAEGVT
jgi:hypothetical protein